MHCEVHVSVHACMNNYLKCTKCEVHDRVRKHVIRGKKKHEPRFLILEALAYNIFRITGALSVNFKFSSCSKTLQESHLRLFLVTIVSLI